MTDSNYSAHVDISTTIINKQFTTTLAESTSAHHHVNIVFIALIIGSLSCVVITFLFMVIKKKGFPCIQSNRARGESVIIDEINLYPWKPVSNKLRIPKNIKKHKANDNSSNDSNDSNIRIIHIEDMDEDDDIYLDPKKSESESKSKSKISISANNFALQTHNICINMNINANDELIEGNEALTEANKNNENEYCWIEMALRTIDENDWKIYLKRFKQNKVTTNRLNTLQDEDWRELLPEIGIRRDFRNLIKDKPK
eukprot:145345_1